MKIWAQAYERGDDIPEVHKANLLRIVKSCFNHPAYGDYTLLKIVKRIRRGMERERQEQQALEMLKRQKLI